MTKHLPNLSVVLPTSSKLLPWKVERHIKRTEQISTAKKVLRASVSFCVVHVGRYRLLWQAESAAMRSAKRHGGFAKYANGVTWPQFPITVKAHDSVKRVAMRPITKDD